MKTLTKPGDSRIREDSSGFFVRVKLPPQNRMISFLRLCETKEEAEAKRDEVVSKVKKFRRILDRPATVVYTPVDERRPYGS